MATAISLFYMRKCTNTLNMYLHVKKYLIMWMSQFIMNLIIFYLKFQYNAITYNVYTVACISQLSWMQVDWTKGCKSVFDTKIVVLTCCYWQFVEVIGTWTCRYRIVPTYRPICSFSNNEVKLTWSFTYYVIRVVL